MAALGSLSGAAGPLSQRGSHHAAPGLSVLPVSCRGRVECSSVSLGRRQQRVLVVCAAGGAEGGEPATPEKDSRTTVASSKSILCNDCDGNGAVQCKQCEGGGVNLKDHFEGRFKEGQLCWLCRGKKQILCGCCNGAGFVGGFLSTQDD